MENEKEIYKNHIKELIESPQKEYNRRTGIPELIQLCKVYDSISSTKILRLIKSEYDIK